MKKIIYLLSLVLFVTSCGSTQDVITDSGDVYSMKGSKYYQGNKDVTSSLSEIEKQDIKSTLNTRLESEKILNQRKEALQKEIDDLKDKLKKLEDAVDDIETRNRDRSRAREAYIKSKLFLIEKENELKRMDKSGNLTEEKRIELEANILKARQRTLKNKSEMDKLKNL